MKPIKLKNSVMHYPWGTADFIPDLLGIDNYEGEPYAELWMGTHPRGESVALEDGRPVSDIIKSDPQNILGKKTINRFGDSLPFLFKVLSAGSPLSIQAHPNKKQAEEGFERENMASIPLDAYNRNYRDNNHKPEIICALTPFTAMCGFRTSQEINTLFEGTGSKKYKRYLYPALNPAEEKEEPAVLKNFFSTYMSFEKEMKRELIEEVLSWATGESSREAELVRKFAELYPGDSGVLSPLFLNVFSLNKGEALFQGPGELHAYVDGTGIELMANSDNVLRGGMTPKNVDLDELLKVLNFGAGKPTLITGKEIKECLFSYETGAQEFLLERAVLGAGCDAIEVKLDSAQIVLCVQGSGKLEYSGGSIDIFKGDSIFIPFALRRYTLTGTAECYISSVPVTSELDGDE